MILLFCEKCVRTGKANLVVLRTISKVTPFGCWVLSNDYGWKSFQWQQCNRDVGRKTQSSRELFIINLGLRFCDLKIAQNCLFVPGFTSVPIEHRQCAS